MKSSSKVKIPDRKQNFWHLASIQNTSLGIPTLILGVELGKSFGAGIALISICIGNFVLWVISLAIVAMAYSERKNAIENYTSYIGRIGGIIGGLVLIFAFLLWYPLQLRSAITELQSNFADTINLSNGFYIRLGAAFGLIIALLSMGGIKLIRWVCVCSFPFIFLFVIYAVFKQPNWPPIAKTLGISLPAIALTISIVLPGTINLPTFFRHARSKSDAFFALSLMVVFYSLFEIAGCIIGFSETSHVGVLSFLSIGSTHLAFITAFIVISLLCVNLVNIYFASAAWEALVPKMEGTKGYAIVGMAGTIVFTLIQVWEPMYYLEDLLGSFIASLGIVILISYLVRRIINHRLRSFEKFLSVVCWILGCITSFLVLKVNNIISVHALFSGMSASALFFLFLLFCEETAWSFKKCVVDNDHQ